MAREQLIQIRRGTAAAWTSANPTLAAGELGFETDTGKFKIGDGSTAWTSLAYRGGSVTIGQAVAGGTATRVLFVDGSGNLADDAGLVFNAATNTLTTNILTALTSTNVVGLRLLDTNASHHLHVTCGSNLTAERDLSIVPGDADRILTFTADATIGGTHSGTSSGTNTGDAAPRGHIDGLILSNNVGDANNDIDISIGAARDGGNTADMVLAASITKRLDAGWTVGTNQGGLDTGAEANSTWYHVWLIKRPDTGVVDALFSTSASAPTMPANYTLKRRIGAVYNTSGGTIRAFKSTGDFFLWIAPVEDIGGTTISSGTPQNFTLSAVPLGVRCLVFINYLVQCDTANPALYSYSPEAGDTTPSSPSAYISDLGAGQNFAFGAVQVLTDTSARIRMNSIGGTDVIVYASSLGYFDQRGKDA